MLHCCPQLVIRSGISVTVALNHLCNLSKCMRCIHHPTYVWGLWGFCVLIDAMVSTIALRWQHSQRMKKLTMLGRYCNAPAVHILSFS